MLLATAAKRLLPYASQAAQAATGLRLASYVPIVIEQTSRGERAYDIFSRCGLAAAGEDKSGAEGRE